MKATEIPEGFYAYLPNQAFEINRLRRVVSEVFESWGYLPVLPPAIEFLNTFKTVDEGLEETSFKLVDKRTGRTLAVRPDFTPQVARMVASALRNEPAPLRLYYSGSVFRDCGISRQLYQTGLELIGVSDPEADAEVISVVVNVLSELGLKSYQIDIGHSAFVELAVKEAGVEDVNETLKKLGKKDISSIELDIESGKVRHPEKLLKLMELYGGEEIIDEADRIFEGAKLKEALSQLKKVYEIIKSYGFSKNVLFDLSERRGMHYHTNITFEVFHPLLGHSLGGGGRYDGVLEKFGKKIPATGAAIRIDRLYELLKKKGIFSKKPKLDVYIIDTKKELKKAFEISSFLRKVGFNVARDIVKRDVESSVSVAFSKGFESVIILNPPQVKDGVLVLFKDGEKISLKEDKQSSKTASKLAKILNERLV